MLSFMNLLVIYIIFIITLKIYLVSIRGKCTSKRKMNGKTVLVTGGSSGIGFYTAKDLASRGARVIITSENEKAVIKAREEIIKATGNKNVIAKYLDFTSLAVTRAFAKDILESEDRLDVLVNNAGSVGFGNKFSKDGILLGLQVNYFGPFLLTMLLIGLLKKTKSSRIVSVASTLSQLGNVNVSKINVYPSLSIFSDVQVYNDSKLYVVYMTWALAERLRNSGVTVNCLHPGCVNTRIFTTVTSWYTPLYLMLKDFFFKTAEQGAQTSIHCAVAEEEEKVTGRYYEDCKQYRPYIRKDLAKIETVWKKSIELVKLSPEEILC